MSPLLSKRLSLIFFLVSISISAGSADPCSHVNESFLESHVAITSYKIISKRPVNSLCEVIIKMQGELIPIYAGSDFVITGNLYRGRAGISRISIDKARRDEFNNNLDSIKSSVAFSYIPAKKNGREVYMFTDPLCNYCNNAMGDVKRLADKYGTIFNIILISFHGKKGEGKAIEAICRNFNFNEYISDEWKKYESTAQYNCPKGSELFKRGESVSDRLGIDGVPAFFADDGFFSSGSDLTTLENRLKTINNN